MKIKFHSLNIIFKLMIFARIYQEITYLYASIFPYIPPMPVPYLLYPQAEK